MSLSLSSEVRPDHVRIRLSGTYTFESLNSLIGEIYSVAAAAGRDRAIIDSRPVEGKMTETDKFFIGSTIAEIFGPKLKAAAIMRPGMITRIGEMAAVNRGARFFVTESESEALSWLACSAQENQR